MKRAGKAGLVAALAITVFALGGIGLLRSLGPDSRQETPAPETRSLLEPVIPSGSLTQAIASLQDRLRVLPTDWRSFASLGLAYVAQARITADPSYYPKAEGVLEQSLRLDIQDNFEALVGMGALALARHDFAGALKWGERARAINPYDGNVYGVIGDAEIELGRYQEAFRTFQKMVDTKPDVASYARVSYARELQGDVPGAIQAMAAARDAAGTHDDASWASYQLGELNFNSARLAKAGVAYRQGVELAPTYIPPHAGLAKVAWARGQVARAIRLYTWVIQRYPLPEYVIALGDLYSISGRVAEAARQYALVRVEERLFKANGVNVDLEIALFDASHGRPHDALVAARAEWDRRHSIQVADALGWALYENGEFGAAAPYARFALHLGMRNALFMFHAGMIQLHLGHTAAARALLSEAVRTNPHFSILYAPVARRTLAKIGGSA